MKIGDIKYLFSLAPDILFKKAFHRIKSSFHDRRLRKVALNNDTRLNLNFPSLGNFGERISIKRLDVSKTHHLDHLIQMYFNHRYDILGSGWVQTGYLTAACGIEDCHYAMNLPIGEVDGNGNWLSHLLPKAYLRKSKEYWEIVRATQSDYEPIDWQKDFKSGFRWDSRVWYKDQRKLMGTKRGVDLKVPWELARLHHLPQIALFASKNSDFRERCIKEFKCQVLDFFATNPPGLGVNFNCAMDVGIRAANLLFAWDLMRQLDYDSILDHSFREILSQNLYLHGRHILEDLEYREGLTSNHYLGNVVGLLFISAYLECGPEINQWLAFSVQELINCMERQFFQDGSNFEGSTSYHRLSGEMMLFGAALVANLNGEQRRALTDYSPTPWSYQAPLNAPEQQAYSLQNQFILPDIFFDKLYRAALFSNAITKPNGCVVQFGDNDSGRFLRLSPNGFLIPHKVAVGQYINLKNYAEKYSDEYYWDENDLSHGTFLSACSAVFEDNRLRSYADSFPLEHTVISEMFKGEKWHDTSFSCDGFYTKKFRKSEFCSSEFPYSKDTFLPFPTNVNSRVHLDLELVLFHDFQLYLLRSHSFLLAIAGMSNKDQHHTWGHSHNDKLSIELNTGGVDLAIDPGTYLYTPLPEKRNAFRSTKAHNTMITAFGEQNKWSNGRMGLFKLYRSTTTKLLDASDKHILLQLRYKSVHQVRKLDVQSNGVLVQDFSNVPFETGFGKQGLYSNGYGKLMKSPLWEYEKNIFR